MPYPIKPILFKPSPSGMVLVTCLGLLFIFTLLILSVMDTDWMILKENQSNWTSLQLIERLETTNRQWMEEMNRTGHLSCEMPYTESDEYWSKKIDSMPPSCITRVMGGEIVSVAEALPNIFCDKEGQEEWYFIRLTSSFEGEHLPLLTIQRIFSLHRLRRSNTVCIETKGAIEAKAYSWKMY